MALNKQEEQEECKQNVVLIRFVKTVSLNSNLHHQKVSFYKLISLIVIITQ